MNMLARSAMSRDKTLKEQDKLKGAEEWAENQRHRQWNRAHERGV